MIDKAKDRGDEITVVTQLNNSVAAKVHETVEGQRTFRQYIDRFARLLRERWRSV